MPTSATANPTRLTSGELEVLKQIALGKSSREAAEDLYCSKRTVDYHLYAIYLKLNVSNRVQAIRRATALGLMSMPCEPCDLLQSASQQRLIQKQPVVRPSEARL